MSDNIQWLNDLLDKVEEKLSDPKKVKFNTHKNRKVFVGELKSLIFDTVKANVDNSQYTRFRTEAAITRPNNKPKVGHSIMTDGMSAMGDDIHKQFLAKQNAREASKTKAE